MDPFVLATFIVAFLAMMIGILAILFTFMERNTNSEKARRHGHKVKYVLDGEKYSPSQLKHGFETDSGVIYSGNVVALVDNDKHLDLYHVTRDGGESIDATHSYYQLPNNPYTQNNLIVVKSSKEVAQRTDDIIGSAFAAVDNEMNAEYEKLLQPIMSKVPLPLTIVSNISPNTNNRKICNIGVFSVQLNQKQPFDAMYAEAAISYRALGGFDEDGTYHLNLSDSENCPEADANTILEIPVLGYLVDTVGTIRSNGNNSNFQIPDPVNYWSVYGFFGAANYDVDYPGDYPGLNRNALKHPSLEIYKDSSDMCSMRICMDFDGVRRPATFSELKACFDSLLNVDYKQALDCTVRIRALFAKKGALE